MILKEILESAEDGFDGRLGIAILHLGTGEEAFLNGDELFRSIDLRINEIRQLIK